MAMRTKGLSHPELQSELNLLSTYIQEITPEIERIWSEAAPHADIRHHGNNLVEQLLRLVAKYPKAVAHVFRAALKGFVPSYKSEDIIGCVEKLAELGQNDEAEWICNEYAAKGSTLLKGTYEVIRHKSK